MVCISKTRADRGKLVLFLESAGQIYSESALTFEASKCVLASVAYMYGHWPTRRDNQTILKYQSPNHKTKVSEE